MSFTHTSAGGVERKYHGYRTAIGSFSTVDGVRFTVEASEYGPPFRWSAGPIAWPIFPAEAWCSGPYKVGRITYQTFPAAVKAAIRGARKEYLEAKALVERYETAPQFLAARKLMAAES